MSGLIFPGLVAAEITRALRRETCARVDQHQGNGLWCVHQLRVRLPDDPTVYRVIVAPADAPLAVGSQPIDQHFLSPIAAPEIASLPAEEALRRIFAGEDR